MIATKERIIPKEFVEKFHKEHPDADIWPSVIADHIALISLIEYFNIKTVFEFGTWRGCTTLLFYSHPNIKKVATLDIHKDMNITYNSPKRGAMDAKGDMRIHEAHPQSEKNFYGSFFRGKPIKQIFCDSMKYVPAEKYDMVFVDANHDYTHVKNDTELALKMAKKIIAWHDYNNGVLGVLGEPGVVVYLDELINAGNKIVATYPGSCVVFMENKEE